MSNILGIDLGGTLLKYVLANEMGEFLYEKTYDSPFKRTSKKMSNGEPEVFIDTILKDIPIEQRVFHYLSRTEADFLNDAKRTISNIDLGGRGYSLCGKTWAHDGKILMIGGNTPFRLATDLGKDKMGIVVAEKKSGDNIKAANDGNAAATAQGIYYKSIKGIDPVETGYFILGTGFGFGIPKYFALTEIGHIPVGFVPKLLWQECGCTVGHKTACTENYVSGRGIENCAKILLSLEGNSVLKGLSEYLSIETNDKNLFDLVTTSKMKNHKNINSKTVMDLAKNNSDGLAVYIANIASDVTAFAAVTAAQLFGLQLIGIGESVAHSNPWHVDNISKKVDSYTKGNTILRPSLKVELTPLKNPAKYGALSLVVPESRYEIWAEKMKKT